MSRDRFLTGILIGISAMIVVALILFFVRQRNVQYLDDPTPKGVLHNYVLSIQQRDFQRAYNYLADSVDKPKFELFRQTFQSFQSSEIADTAVEIGDVADAGTAQTVQVPISVIRGGRDPFAEPYRSQESATLVRQGSEWKVSRAPYPYWGYMWDQPPGGSLPFPAPTATP